MKTVKVVKQSVQREVAVEVCTCDWCGKQASTHPARELTRDNSQGYLNMESGGAEVIPLSRAELFGWRLVASALQGTTAVADLPLMCPDCWQRLAPVPK